MIFQTDNYSCGPCAIVNACLALGHRHDVNQVAHLANTTKTHGTDERGILAALASMEYTVLELTARGPDLWSHVRTALNTGQAVILCVDDEDHWVAVIGVLGTRVVMFDSQRTTENIEAHGVWLLDESEFRDRLGDSRYAIRVGEYPEEKDSLGRDISDEITAQLVGVATGQRPTQNDYDNYVPELPDRMPDDLADWILGGGR